MGCIRCGSPMSVVGDKMVCTNDACGYQYEITVFNEDDLTKENQRLRQLITNCIKYIQDAIDWCEHDNIIIVSNGKELLADIYSGIDKDR